MTAKMQKFLAMSSRPYGGATGCFETYKAATLKGWVEFAGYNQNSTTPRYRITEAGAKALAAAQ
jgi:hypothetical protein